MNIDNQQKQISPSNNESAPGAALGFQLRKGLDRLGFEADRLMRGNRIRSEANRLRDQADERIFALGRKVMELSENGLALDPDLQTVVSEIKALEVELKRKKQEIEAISGEVWVAPPAPLAPARPSSPPPRDAGGRQAQISSPSAPAMTQPAASATTTPEQPRSQARPQHTDAKECPVCHAELRPQAAFCANCGYKLAQA